MTTKHDVIRAHRAHPKWNAADIARHLGCHPAYVRTTVKRNNLTPPKGQPPANPNSKWSLGGLAQRLGLTADDLRAASRHD